MYFVTLFRSNKTDDEIVARCWRHQYLSKGFLCYILCSKESNKFNIHKLYLLGIKSLNNFPVNLAVLKFLVIFCRNKEGKSIIRAECGTHNKITCKKTEKLCTQRALIAAYEVKRKMRGKNLIVSHTQYRAPPIITPSQP